MEIISIKQHPEWLERGIAFFQAHWASKDSLAVYQDCLESMMDSPSPLPQWYLLVQDDHILGGAGLITNDFISRMDLWPYCCAVYIEEAVRGQHLSFQLMDYIKEDTKRLGFNKLYLSTDHIGYYEKMGFEFLAKGHHPWGETSSIYVCHLDA